MRKSLGCGWDGYAGQGERTLPSDDTDDPEVLHTCAHYLARQPFVASVRRYLPDFKRGGLGGVWDLPALLYDSLTILEAEEGLLERWMYEEQDRIINDGC